MGKKRKIKQTPPEGELTMTRYFRKYANRSFYWNLGVLCIAGYLLWALLAAQAIWAYMPLVEIIGCIILTVLMHVFKSRICSFLLIDYGVLGLVAGVVFSDVVNLTASVALGLGTASLIAFCMEYKKYKKQQIS